MLSGYIRFISTKVRVEVKDEIDDQIERKLNHAQKAYQMDLERIANARNVNVQRLKYALEIANAAGLKSLFLVKVHKLKMILITPLLWG